MKFLRVNTTDPAFHLFWIGKVDPMRHHVMPHWIVELTGYVELAMGKLLALVSLGFRGLEIEGLPFVRVAGGDEGFARAILDFARAPRRAERRKVLAPLRAFIRESLEAWRTSRMADVS